MSHPDDPLANSPEAGVLENFLQYGEPSDGQRVVDLYDSNNNKLKRRIINGSVSAERFNNPPRITVTEGDMSVNITVDPDTPSGEELTFTNGDSGTWSDPLKFVYMQWGGNQLPIDDYTLSVWLRAEVSIDGSNLSKGDKITFDRLSQTFSGAKGFVTLIDRGGTDAAPSYRFTLRDSSGNAFPDGSAQTIVSDAYETGGSGYLNTKKTVTFTNSSGSTWNNVGQVRCEVMSGTVDGDLLDVATFDSIDIGSGEELRITSIYHDLTY